MSMVEYDDDAAPLAVRNPFGERQQAVVQQTASDEATIQREVAEVQAGAVVAHRFPRDRITAMDGILQECTRLSLAQQAVYNYSRGGTEISGPSIRLAEVIAQHWGNLSFGIVEISRGLGESKMEAFCYDLQTNLRARRGFIVKHERYSREGGRRALTGDIDRDVNELTANQGARRLRACILAVVPGDVKERAVEQCEATLLAKADTSPEAVAKLVEAFKPFGVTRAQIEARIQRRIDTIRPAQIVQLRKTWASLNDGMSAASDWFPKIEAEGGEPAEPEAKGSEALKAKLRPQSSTARSAEPTKTTSDSATPASPASSAPDASSPPTPAAPSSAGESATAERPTARAASARAGGPAPTEAAATASKPGTAPGTPATGADTSGELPLREPGEEG